MNTQSSGLIRPLLASPALLVIALVAMPCIALLPTLRSRRIAARAAVRTFLALAGIRLRVTGLDLLPPGAAVIVANHASYIDGPALFAALPPRFGFVIKKEVSRQPVTGFLLRRIDHEFVDRFNRHAGAADVRRILRVVASGRSLVFFPEGTITARPPLGRFHTGAFVTAQRAAAPVVAIAIHGSRRVLPAERKLLRSGTIHIDVLATLPPANGSEPSPAVLRDRAHCVILAALEEPVAETQRN